MEDISLAWKTLSARLEKQIGDELNLKAILYLIGVQELNKGVKTFSKEEKLDVLHVAVCKLLTPFGYYAFEKIDAQGWPHWKEIKPIKDLPENEQEFLMKKAIIHYFS